jgi:hypothetical protein
MAPSTPDSRSAPPTPARAYPASVTDSDNPFTVYFDPGELLDR